MKFIRATRTNGALVLINVDHITAMQLEASERLAYTAIILHNGREIDVTDTPDELLETSGMHVVEL